MQDRFHVSNKPGTYTHSYIIKLYNHRGGEVARRDSYSTTPRNSGEQQATTFRYVF